jgi:hypothetical protein
MFAVPLKASDPPFFKTLLEHCLLFAPKPPGVNKRRIKTNKQSAHNNIHRVKQG